MHTVQWEPETSFMSSPSWGTVRYSNSSMLTLLHALHLRSQPLLTYSNIYTPLFPYSVSLVFSFYISPLSLCLWHTSCILNSALFFLFAFTSSFSPHPFLPRCCRDSSTQRGSALRWDQLGLSEVISGSEWVQLGELGRGRDPSPQQINVDTNYKMGLVIDCGLYSFLIL